jgi:hypothetical protein
LSNFSLEIQKPHRAFFLSILFHRNRLDNLPLLISGDDYPLIARRGEFYRKDKRNDFFRIAACKMSDSVRSVPTRIDFKLIAFLLYVKIFFLIRQNIIKI